MKHLIKAFAGFALILFGYQATAQDAHFSQYFSSPLYTNPALTGQINGNLRINSLYRTQWNPFGNTFNTFSLSADARKNAFGFGILVLDQVSSEINFNTLNVQLSGSYDLSYNSGSVHHFVFGLQAGIYGRMVNSSKITTPDMYEEGFGAVNGANEDFSSLNSISPDFNFGFLYFNGSARRTIAPFAGASIFHIIPPSDSFDGKTKLPTRFLVHGGLRIKTGNGLDVTPHLKFAYQKEAIDGIIGATVGYTLVDTYTRIEGGLAYRYGDALVPYVGFTYKDLSAGFSYDANVSSLSDVGNFKNTFELSLTYIFKKYNYKEQYICPRL